MVNASEKVHVGINGFGRVGRQVVRIFAENPELRPNLQLIAINDPGPGGIKGFAHLLKYDSTHGKFNRKIEVIGDDTLRIEGIENDIKFLTSKDVLGWNEFGIELVLESSGKFANANEAKDHIEKGGAEKVLVSAPSKGADATIVFGVNHAVYNRSMRIISNASCTTNCLAPVAYELDKYFGIEKGLMTTIHAITNDQVSLDGPHKDFRRARTAMASMIPTTTGAAKAVGLVLPRLQGKLNGIAIRIPTFNVSLVDLAVNLSKINVKEVDINAVMKEASEGELEGTLFYTDEPLVSIDFNHTPYQSIFDASLTQKNGNLYKVLAWYDNEWGFANSYVKTANYIAEQGV